MTKMLYEYSPKTGEFIATNPATPDPKHPGQYLARLNATFIAPPETGEHEIAIWKDGQWEITPDWRGTTYYLRNESGQIQTVEIKELGQTVPDNAYLNRKDIPKTEEEKASQIRSLRNSLLNESDVVIIRYAEFDVAAPKDWTDYRQALRDIPQQESFPDNVVWPEKPDEV